MMDHRFMQRSDRNDTYLPLAMFLVRRPCTHWPILAWGDKTNTNQEMDLLGANRTTRKRQSCSRVSDDSPVVEMRYLFRVD